MFVVSSDFLGYSPACQSAFHPHTTHLPPQLPAQPVPGAGFNQALGIIVAIAISHYMAHLCGTDSVYHDDLRFANDSIMFLHEVSGNPSFYVSSAALANHTV